MGCRVNSVSIWCSSSVCSFSCSTLLGGGMSRPGGCAGEDAASVSCFALARRTASISWSINSIRRGGMSVIMAKQDLRPKKLLQLHPFWQPLCHRSVASSNRQRRAVSGGFFMPAYRRLQAEAGVKINVIKNGVLRAGLGRGRGSRQGRGCSRKSE